MLRRSIAPETADAVISCVAWPGLAKQVLTWRVQGVRVAAVLAHLPEERIRNADVPAGYLKAVLRRSIDVRQNTALATPTTTPTTAAAAGVTEASRDGVPESPFPIRELDPTNAVEREQLQMSRVAGPVADDAYIEQVLAADDPGRTWIELNGTSQTEVLLVVDPEPSQDQVSCAELERAVVQAEHGGAPTAGALRAQLAHRSPDSTTRRPSPAVKPTAPPTPGPVPVRDSVRPPLR